MEIRYGVHPRDAVGYDTQRLRSEFLIESLYRADEPTAFYSHADRMLVMGAMPVHRALRLDEKICLEKDFCTAYLLERREAIMLNIASAGAVTVDGVRYALGNRDCLYAAQGSREVIFESDSAGSPAKFFIVSAPALHRFQTGVVRFAQVQPRVVGRGETANERAVYNYLPNAQQPTCQLSLGITVLSEGSVWNTMPTHTHERRMEVYSYIGLPEGEVVFHLMGVGQQTRHIVMQNEQAVISPPWSVHAGVGTAPYTLVWAMAGENQVYDDKDEIPNADLR